MVRRAAFYFRGRGWISVYLLLGLLTLLMSGEVRFLKLSLGNHYITESRLVWGECQKNVLLLFTQIKWRVLLSVSEITTVINGHRFACSFWIAKFSKQDSLILLKNSIGMIGYVEMQKEIIKKKKLQKAPDTFFRARLKQPNEHLSFWLHALRWDRFPGARRDGTISICFQPRIVLLLPRSSSARLRALAASCVKCLSRHWF